MIVNFLFQILKVFLAICTHTWGGETEKETEGTDRERETEREGWRERENRKLQQSITHENVSHAIITGSLAAFAPSQNA